MKFNPVLIVVLVAFLALAGWMLVKKPEPATNTTVIETSANPEPTNPVTQTLDQSTIPDTTGTLGVSTTTENPEVKTFEIEGGSFYFKPNEIRVNKGDKVKIVLNSVDMMHDFVIDDLNVRTEIIKSGDTGTVEFTADKAGTFEFYCSVGQHRQQGMTGELIVE